jgi:branched-chain amino acid transport system permease protein
MTALTLVIAGITNGSLYALVALGLVLIYKTQGVVNFAHGEVLMVGAFIGYTTFALVGLPYPVAFVVAIILGGVLGALIERTCFRRVVAQSHTTLAMVAVGLSVLLKGAARLPFGSDVYTFPAVFGSAGPVSIGPALIAPQNLVTTAVAVALTLLLLPFFRLTTLGKQMRATQQNMTGARIVGVNVNRIFSFAWSVAAAMGAAAGILVGPISMLYPDMGTAFLLKGFASAVLGGFDSIPGAIVGGFLVGIIEMLFGGYLSTAFQEVSPFCIIILVLFFKPNGLFGRPSVKRV